MVFELHHNEAWLWVVSTACMSSDVHSCDLHGWMLAQRCVIQELLSFFKDPWLCLCREQQPVHVW
jgi:hypothetical protein